MGRRLSDTLAAADCIGLDRDSWIKLPHQVADALRLAIANGTWTLRCSEKSTLSLAEIFDLRHVLAKDTNTLGFIGAVWYNFRQRKGVLMI